MTPLEIFTMSIILHVYNPSDIFTLYSFPYIGLQRLVCTFHPVSCVGPLTLLIIFLEQGVQEIL